MKKITLLLLFLTVSLGYSQVVLENFETPLPGEALKVKDGMAVNVVSDPEAMGTRGQVLQLITAAAGQPWQQAELYLQGEWIDLTSSKIVSVDVYSDPPLSFLARVTDGTGPDGATAKNHPGGGWQTIDFDFSLIYDGKGPANGLYEGIWFFPLWGDEGNTNAWCSGCGENNALATTTYVDNITAFGATAPATCTDGIQNQGETGIDCGGPCDACITDAPNPTTPNAEVFAILESVQDTGGFTNFWALADFFGENEGEIDVDQTAGVDKALKMDFSVAGWGGGIDGTTTVDVSSYGWLHFDYYVPNIAPGSLGHQIKFVLIDNDNESDYVIAPAGGDAVIAFDSWVSVDIPLSTYVGKGFNTSALRQFKIGSDSDLNTTLAYFDNMYFSVNQGTLGTEDFSKAKFNVYPNPSQDSWTVRTENVNMSSIKVFDVLGKRVLSLTPNANEAKIDGSSLKSGLYFAQIKTETGINSLKLVKK